MDDDAWIGADVALDGKQNCFPEVGLSKATLHREHRQLGMSGIEAGQADVGELEHPGVAFAARHGKPVRLTQSGGQKNVPEKISRMIFGITAQCARSTPIDGYVESSPPLSESSDPKSRPYLVFMRTGTAGLYPRWLEQEPDRNWDLFVSAYVPTEPEPAAIATEMGGYNKLEHFRDCVVSGRLDLSLYRFVMLADDDLDVTCGSISAFFESIDRLGLAVSHPAQDWSGYWSHRIMLRNPLAEWRETNFVEIMCPCFDTDFLTRRLGDIPVTLSTWGSDYGYSHLARSDGGTIGVIDTAVIRHVKPIRRNGAFYLKLEIDGVTPIQELNTVLEMLPPRDRLHKAHPCKPRRVKWPAT